MATVVEILEALGKIGAREAETGLKGLQIFKPVQYLDDAARRYGSGSDKVSLVDLGKAKVSVHNN